MGKSFGREEEGGRLVDGDGVAVGQDASAEGEWSPVDANGGAPVSQQQPPLPFRPTPAQQAGLKGGDVLLKANDQRLTSPRVLERVLNIAADREVKLTILRQKQQQTVTLKWVR